MARAACVDLAGRRVLVVEDQFVIALDMEQMLRALGAGAVDLATGIPEALAVIARTPPDLAVLDLRLRSQTTVPIAEALRAQAIPLIFATGYADTAALPASLRDSPLLLKPVDIAALARILAEVSFPSPIAKEGS